MVEKIAQGPKAKTGDRKRKGASEKPRRVMAFRVNDDLYARLEAAAQGRGFSLSEEIEARLTESCQSTPDPYIGTALRMAAVNCATIQHLLGRNIAEDAYARAACAKAAASAIELVGGLVGQNRPSITEMLQADAEKLGQLIALFSETAVRNGIEDETVGGLYTIAAAVTERYKAQADQQARTAELARLLRGGAPADPAPEPTLRPATPDELAGMVDAPGQLPPSIADQAIFDDAVAGLPLVQAEKAEAAKRREKAPLDVGAGSPDAMAPPAAPQRRNRTKAAAEK